MDPVPPKKALAGKAFMLSQLAILSTYCFGNVTQLLGTCVLSAYPIPGSLLGAAWATAVNTRVYFSSSGGRQAVLRLNWTETDTVQTIS